MLASSRHHLIATGESYFKHFRFATTVGLLAVAAGVACLIHALVPGLCTGTASRTIRRLSALMDERHQLDDIRQESSEAMAFVLLIGVAALVVVPLWIAEVPAAVRLVYTALAFAIPLTLLFTNRELEAVPAR